MILRSSPASPFGRKVRMAAIILGLDAGITVKPADTADPGDSVRQQNPLGKIPALVLDDGMVLFDSRVILDCVCRSSPTASGMPRFCGSMRRAGAIPPSMSRNGSTIRPAR